MSRFDHIRPTQPAAHRPAAPPTEPRRPRGRYGFRWEYFTVPMLLLFAMWIVAGVSGEGCSFESVMDAMHVRDRDQYRQLGVLAVVGVGATLLVKILRGR